MQGVGVPQNRDSSNRALASRTRGTPQAETGTPRTKRWTSPKNNGEGLALGTGARRESPHFGRGVPAGILDSFAVGDSLYILHGGFWARGSPWTHLGTPSCDCGKQESRDSQCLSGRQESRDSQCLKFIDRDSPRKRGTPQNPRASRGAWGIPIPLLRCWPPLRGPSAFGCIWLLRQELPAFIGSTRSAHKR